MNPHIHAFKVGGKQSWQAVCAIRLESCYAERLDEKAQDEAVARWLARQMDFINALYMPEGTRTFAVRFITRPRAEMFSAGRVDVVLLGKTRGMTKTGATEAAQTLCREATALLSGAMPDYQWAVVTERAAFESLWMPFALETAHVCELRRREELVSLESLRSRPSLGRGRTDTVLSPSELKSAAYFVHQFLPRPTTLARFVRTLLLHSEPVMFQVALRPVRLEASEKAALHDLIGRCEKSREQEKGDAVFEAASVHQLRARALCQGLLELSLRLEDAPYLLQVTLASPTPLPSIVIEGAGVEVTHPVWNRLATSGEIGEASSLQGGGYDTAYPLSTEEQTVARTNAAQLDFVPWGTSFAPEPLRRLRQLVDAGEAAAAFRFPLATLDGLMGIDVHTARSRPIPRELANLAMATEPNRLCIGENVALGQRQPVFFSEQDRRQHTYVVGQTGTGKTTLLRTMILNDIAAGRGLAVIDPHGDLYRELLDHIPPERWDDVVLLDPTDVEFPVGFNLLDCKGEDARHFVVREMRSIMEKLIVDQYGPGAREWAGPRFFLHMQMNMLLAMSNPENPGTLIEFHEIFQHKDFWSRWVPLHWNDAILERWVNTTLAKTNYTTFHDNCTLGEWIASKFDDFVFDPKLRMIFGQKHSSIDLGRIMDEGKILLVNLSKGVMAESNARFFGMILMAKIQAAAMQRVRRPIAERKMFYLYVDEFQSIATENFIGMLSEARKFGLGLVLANQFFTQVDDQRIMQSIVGNVGTTVCFRVGREDAEGLEPVFLPAFDRHDLANLPNWTACVKTTVKGQIASPFTLRTLPLPAAGELSSAAEIIARSRARYARPRAEVAEEIRQSLGPTRIPSPNPSTPTNGAVPTSSSVAYTESSGQTLTFPDNAALLAHVEKKVHQEQEAYLRNKLRSEPNFAEELLATNELLDAKVAAAKPSAKQQSR